MATSLVLSNVNALGSRRGILLQDAKKQRWMRMDTTTLAAKILFEEFELTGTVPERVEPLMPLLRDLDGGTQGGSFIVFFQFSGKGDILRAGQPYRIEHLD